ncbi:MAG: aspartate kinase [Chloroflexi bacterium]|nr:aspartate kinase [Chloroflexota bacterium]MQC19496.1 aspartate kinase [Chloroflexota bacterium]
MALAVQKFGGSSVADADKIRRVARRIAARVEAGDRVVAVVSAMGDRTDELIALATEVTAEPRPRELDVLLSTGEVVSSTLLSMALHDHGLDAVSLSGAQAGIRTDAVFGRARIAGIDTARIERELAAGRVVIVAGFQGVSASADLDVTTLGRGGSDTTAVALAAALGADSCEIYTDVAGVYTADPRICPRARPLADVGYDEMLELATTGARVMHARAVEVGALHGVEIRVASTFDEDAPGTRIHAETTMEQANKVRGIAHQSRVGRVTVRGVPDRPGIAARLFTPLADAGVSVDTIVQNVSTEQLTDMTFTVAASDLDLALRTVQGALAELGAAAVVGDSDVGSVSIVGTGMASSPGFAAAMFRTLHEHEVNIELISTSEIRITCVVDAEKVPEAVRALHDAFSLDSQD